MLISLYHLGLCYNTKKKRGLNSTLKILMRYTLFPWDCSSIGQSTALSRRKLRVRAPSVPTDQIKTSIHLYIFFLAKEAHQNEQHFSHSTFSIGIFFLFQVFLTKDKQIYKLSLLQLVPIGGERQNCISLIVGNIIFLNIIVRIPRDSVLRLVLKFIASI